MAKVEDETIHVWCHKLRIAVILATLRHFRDKLNRVRAQVHQLSLALLPANVFSAGYSIAFSQPYMEDGCALQTPKTNMIIPKITLF
jgi:hypothetical protein